MASPQQPPVNQDTSLTPRVVIAYGLPAIVLAAYALTYYIYLPKFYADWVGISLTSIGVIAVGSRIWDAVTDPTIGFLSDRTRSRWGRRRPWMLFGTVPLAIVYYLLFTPPAGDVVAGTYRLALLTFVFFLVWTVIAVPYESLGAEISQDYDERNRVFGVREGAFLVGTMIGAALPGIFASGSIERTAVGFRWLTVLYGLLAVALIGLCVRFVPERHATRTDQDDDPLLERFPLRRNRPFVILQSAYTVFTLGAATASTMFLFFVEHVLDSRRGPAFVALYIGLGILCLPLWVRLANRREKRTVWLASLLVNTAALWIVAFLGPGDGVVFAVCVAVGALGLGGTIAIPPSMQADVIDYDEWKTGRRREGRFIGLWSLAKKFAMAASIGLALPILDMTGYLEGSTIQPAGTVTALRWLYVGVPVICNLLAMLLVLGYPLTRAEHGRLRAELEARRRNPIGIGS